MQAALQTSMSSSILHETEGTAGTDLLTFAFDSPYEVDEQKPIYIDAENPTRSLNKTQTRILVRRLIAGFHAAGLKKGESILVALANNVLYSALQFGIIGAGGVHMGANPRSSVSEFDHIIRLARPRFIVTSLDVLPTIQQAAVSREYCRQQFYLLELEDFPFPFDVSRECTPSSNDHTRSLDRDLDNPQSLLRLLDHSQSDWIRFSNETTAKATPAAMFSTSGTSGLPKAAVLSHYALVSQHLSIMSNPTYQVRRLMTLPSFHILAAMFLHIYAVRLGQPVYIMRRFEAEPFIRFIKDFQITDIYLVPPMVNSLLQSSQSLRGQLQSLRFLAVGGAPIQADMMQKLEAQLHPSATFTQIWGLTEVGAVTFHKYPEQGGCDGSIGRPLPGYEMRLVDNDGSVIGGDNLLGEAQVRYEGMMTGYKNKPPHPKGEWYSTGDAMTRLNGKYFVIGRFKELIKVNGFQVAPAEVEATLLSHPDVSDAAVIGIMHQTRATEVPRAFVVRRSNSDLGRDEVSADEIYEFARQRLASYKALEGGIIFVKSIPRTASGKIQRFKLEKMDDYHSQLVKRYISPLY